MIALQGFLYVQYGDVRKFEELCVRTGLTVSIPRLREAEGTREEVYIGALFEEVAQATDCLNKSIKWKKIAAAVPDELKTALLGTGRSISRNRIWKVP